MQVALHIHYVFQENMCTILHNAGLSLCTFYNTVNTKYIKIYQLLEIDDILQHKTQSSAAYNSVFKWMFAAIFRWIFTSSLYQQSGLRLIQNRTLHVLNTQELQSLFMQASTLLEKKKTQLFILHVNCSTSTFQMGKKLHKYKCNR